MPSVFFSLLIGVFFTVMKRCSSRWQKTAEGKRVLYEQNPKQELYKEVQFLPTSMSDFQHEFVFAKLDYLQHSRPPTGTIAHPVSIMRVCPSR